MSGTSTSRAAAVTSAFRDAPDSSCAPKAMGVRTTVRSPVIQKSFLPRVYPTTPCCGKPFSKRHLLDGKPSQCTPVFCNVRRHANCRAAGAHRTLSNNHLTPQGPACRAFGIVPQIARTSAIARWVQRNHLEAPCTGCTHGYGPRRRPPYWLASRGRTRNTNCAARRRGAFHCHIAARSRNRTS